MTAENSFRSDWTTTVFSSSLSAAMNDLVQSYFIRLPSDLRMNPLLSERPLIERSGILGNVCCLLVSMDTPVHSTATSWFPRVYNFHFRILGNVFVNSFPRNGSTYHNMNSVHMLLHNIVGMLFETQCI
jgi:hypothetical protein